MINLGLEADVVSYNAAISACTKGRQWASALSLLAQMRSEGIAPNVITFNAAIGACERGCVPRARPPRGGGHFL